MNLIRNIYSWLNPIYGTELYEYLKGNDCDGVYIGPNHFLTIGLSMGITVILLLILYYKVIDHPRLNRWWHWLIFLLLTSVISILTGLGYTYSKLNGGFIPACFTHSEVQTAQDGSIYGVEGTEILFNYNCWQFGIANAIIAIALFFILSLGFKWGSRNSKYSPF